MSAARSIFLVLVIGGPGVGHVTAQTPREYVVGCLDESRDGWSLLGPGRSPNETPEIADFIVSPANFGPGGIVEDKTFTIVEVQQITAASLAGIDIFHIVFDGQGFSQNVPTLANTELDALVAFVKSGRALMIFVGVGSESSSVDDLLGRFGMRTGNHIATPALPTIAMPNDLRVGPFGTIAEVSWTRNTHPGIAINDAAVALPLLVTAGGGNELVLATGGDICGPVLAFGDYFNSYTSVVSMTWPFSNGFDVLMGNVMSFVTTAIRQDSDGDGVSDECDVCPGSDASVDGDAVPDGCDNCPGTANADQSDADADDLGDACDACPSDADNDIDGDGVCGDIDNCPATANADQADSDGDGLGDACDAPGGGGSPGPPAGGGGGGGGGAPAPAPDADGDGVPDASDDCPDDPDKTATGVCGCGIADDDTDADGVPDCFDVCPDEDDRADDDADGVLNCFDGCRADSNKREPGVCGCGVPDDDTDGDGVLGCRDNCPDVSNPQQADGDGNGVGDACESEAMQQLPDADGDGVIDDLDNCPSDANADQPDSDGDGIGDVCDACPDDAGNLCLESPLCIFCGIGCGSMLVTTFVGLLTMGQMRRRKTLR